MEILIVDDNQADSEKLAKVILNKGWGVPHTVHNGEEALEAISSKKIDVVFLEINLQGMDGLSCLKEIVKSSGGVNVIILTTFGSVHTFIDAMNHGAIEYITKPFRLKDLLAALRKVNKQIC